ncbi:hypothetical protein C8R47DRAFT_1275951 [Mycena vitilis]|nr:hypothetical protein C8R47DRAFT_1206352 [Mycena vitilis]KAJ6515001.1 hypothetical protein C8R47DRAFT_1206354 [Mycena vitilis]KAJ6515003.1 hypothetical protein C8R47DRAFT_1275951 [Mycena vitilis]
MSHPNQDVHPRKSGQPTFQSRFDSNKFTTATRTYLETKHHPCFRTTTIPSPNSPSLSCRTRVLRRVDISTSREPREMVDFFCRRQANPACDSDAAGADIAEITYRLPACGISTQIFLPPAGKPLPSRLNATVGCGLQGAMRATEAPRSGAELAETMYRGPASGASKQIFLPPAGKVPAYAFNAAQPTCIFRLPQAPRSGADVVASMEGGRSVLGQGCSHCVLFHDVSPSGKRELHGYSIAATAASTPALTAKPQTQNSIFELPASGISSTGLDSGAMCTIPAQNAGCGAKILGLFEPRRRAEKSIIHATLESIRVFFRAAGAGLNQVNPENLPCGAFTLSVNFEGQILKNFLMRSVKLELRGKNGQFGFTNSKS